MGQTLSHGVYLPAEGERNCYSGLASNWNLLDTAIGDTAGKASATHTHGNITTDGKVGTTANLPLITGTGGVVQAGAFGNQANTFCEGNDSRLSDARTPVAHTHTKSDVTDLLNSNFIPSANNSYDLGSSSYQWSNAYIKSLTINGVACGDILTHNVSEFVGVTGNQTIGGTKTFSNIIYTSGQQIIIKNNNVERTVLPASTIYMAFAFSDKDSVGVASRFSAVENVILPNGDVNLDLRAYDFSSKTNAKTTVVLERKYDGTSNFYPEINNATDLGTSTNKWKTLNGVNPGALSLPDYSAEFDVSGQIVPPTGENQISINWGRNTFTPSVNGWLSVRIHKATSIEIYRSIRSSYCVASRVESADDICACSPVVAGVEYTIKIQATQFSSDYDHFRLSPCFGNV